MWNYLIIAAIIYAIVWMNLREKIIFFTVLVIYCTNPDLFFPLIILLTISLIAIFALILVLKIFNYIAAEIKTARQDSRNYENPLKQALMRRSAEHEHELGASSGNP